MIEMLELTILFNGIGNITMSYLLVGIVHWQDIFILAVGIIYIVSPMQEIAEYLFPN